MVEHLNKYETLFVVSTKKSEEEIEALVEKFKALIEANATVDSVDLWGKRRLAYPINYETEGYYALINFTAKPEFPKELERNYGITDGILRFIVVKKEEE